MKKKKKSGVSLIRARSILVRTPQCSRLKNELHRMPSRKNTTTYILHIVPTYLVYITHIIVPIGYHYAYATDSRSIGKKEVKRRRKNKREGKKKNKSKQGNERKRHHISRP